MILSLLFLACGDKSMDSAVPPPATFSEVENGLLGVSCAFSTCHGSNAGGLFLDGETDYERLVNIEAIAGNGTYVIPNDADGSYIVQKVEGASNIIGEQMPNSEGISDEQLRMLRSWINNNAPND